MKILVCGGRDFNDEKYVFDTLDSYKDQITAVVSGGAKGADFLAAKWALLNAIQTHIYVAEWDKYGKGAGHIRNAKMLEKHPEIELVVAFPGGKGTANMIGQAKKKNILVIDLSHKGKTDEG